MPGHSWRSNFCFHGHRVPVGDSPLVTLFRRFRLIAIGGNRQPHCGSSFGQFCRHQTAAGAVGKAWRLFLAPSSTKVRHCFRFLRLRPNRRQSGRPRLSFSSSTSPRPLLVGIHVRPGPSARQGGREAAWGVGHGGRKRRDPSAMAAAYLGGVPLPLMLFLFLAEGGARLKASASPPMTLSESYCPSKSGLSH